VLLKDHAAGQKGPRKFRFEAGWELNERCCDIIAHSWKENKNHVDPLLMMSWNMEECKKSLLC
jgi:hypothetical protein